MENQAGLAVFTVTDVTRFAHGDILVVYLYTTYTDMDSVDF